MTVTLTDDQARAAQYAVAEFLRRRRISGQPTPPAVARLAQHLAMSAHGPQPVCAPTPLKPEMCDTQEVAHILGCSTRHARRLAPTLEAQRIAGRWVYPRRNVTEYKEGQQQRPHPLVKAKTP